MQFAQIQTNNTSRVVGQVYISQDEPSTQLGTLTVIIEVTDTELRHSEELDELLDHIIDSYYSFEGRLSKQDTPETVLESVATSLNQSLKDFFPTIQASSLLSHLSIYIGAVQNRNLYFTRMGDIRVFLQHGSHLIHVTEDQDELDEGALFSYITAGQLKSNDSVLVTTPSLLDYFSEAKVTNILQDYEADEAVNALHQLVEEFSSSTLFQAIVFKNDVVNAHAVAPAPNTHEDSPTLGMNNVGKESAKAKHSIDNLLSVERETSDLLSSSFWPSLKKNIGQLQSQLKGVFNNDPVTKTSDSQTAADLAIQRRIRERSVWNKSIMMGWTLLQGLFVILTWGFKQIWIGSKHVFQRRGKLAHATRSYTYHATKVAKKLPSTFSNLPKQTTQTVKHALTKYRGLHKKRQRLLIAGAVLVIVLIISISLGMGSNIGGRSTEEIISILNEVDVKQASADAALIYGNESQAANLISEARTLLSNLGDIKDDKLATRKSVIATDLFEMYKKIQKLTELNNPTIVATLTADDTGTPLIMTSITGQGDRFYGFDDQQNIYDFNLRTNEIGIAGTAPNTVVDVIPQSENELFVYLETPEATLATLTISEQELKPVSITFNNALSRKSAIVPYFSKIYVLDPRERQIFRHQLIGNTYTSGQPWVQDTSVDLSNATDMVIDGNIWVLTGDGEIIKLSGGERENFTLASIDPILNTPNFIWTNVDSNYLYILDPPTRRVVIAFKDGSIYKQFVSEKFDNMKSAVIDEPNKKIYILNGHQIFEVPFD